MIRRVSIDSNIKSLDEMEPLLTVKTEKAPRIFEIFVKVTRTGGKMDVDRLPTSSAFGGRVHDIASSS